MELCRPPAAVSARSSRPGSSCHSLRCPQQVGCRLHAQPRFRPGGEGARQRSSRSSHARASLPGSVENESPAALRDGELGDETEHGGSERVAESPPDDLSGSRPNFEGFVDLFAVSVLWGECAHSKLTCERLARDILGPLHA